MKPVPVYQPIVFVQRIADRLSAALRGPVPDSRVVIEIAKELEARPDLIIHTSIAVDLFRKWHRVSNKILNNAAGLYVPTLHIKVAKGVTLRQREIELPHLDTWDTLDLKGFTATQAAYERRAEHRQQWRLDMRKTGLGKLWEVQHAVYGFDETKAPDPFFKEPPDDDDDDGEDA